MKQMNWRPTRTYPVLLLFFFLNLPGCGEQGLNDNQLSESRLDLSKYQRMLVEPQNFRSWNYQVLFGISWLKEYTTGLKEILVEAHGGGNVQQFGNGLQLQEDLNLIAGEGPRAQQAVNIVDRAEAFAKEWAAKGQFLNQLATVNRAMVDARGLAMKNQMDAVGKAVDNQGAALENINKVLINELTRAYIGAYAAYVRSYGSYAVLIGKLYQKIDKNSQFAIGASVQDLGKFRRQANICMARASRLWHKEIKGANFEMEVAQIHWNSLTSKFNWYTSQPFGEECLNRVLLSSHSPADKFLYNLDLNLTVVDGRKKKLYCGRQVNLEEFPGEIWATDQDLMEYPPFVKKEIETKDLDDKPITVQSIAGIYWPVTYYQLYRVLTNSSPDLRIEINTPPDVEAQSCHIKNSDGITLTRPDMDDQVKYKLKSREFERDFLEVLNLEEEARFGTFEDFKPVDSQLEDMSIAEGNTAYKTLIMRLTGIFQAVDGCRQSISSRRQLDPVLNGPGGEAVTPAPEGPAPAFANQEFVEGKPVESILAQLDDPIFPQMSESVRTCMQLAEQHRYNAMAKLHIVNAVHELLQKQANTPPPQMPAPPFEPIEANVNNLHGVFQ